MAESLLKYCFKLLPLDFINEKRFGKSQNQWKWAQLLPKKNLFINYSTLQA